jgi:dienelactone hydrolase
MTTTVPETFEIGGGLGPIRGDIYRDTGAKEGVVICHGFKGFARWGFFPHLARRVAAARMNAIVFDFSGSGVGEDRESWTGEELFGKNTFSTELEDLDKVVAFARKENLIGERYGLFGHSRGGGVAILRAASDPDVGALVTWASISRVRRWEKGESDAWRQRGFAEIANSRTGQVMKLGTALLDDVDKNEKGSLDIEAAAKKITAPWAIFHGTADETVDQEESKSLHEWSGHSKLNILPGNHGFGARHPLLEVSPSLEEATAETVLFFSANLLV